MLFLILFSLLEFEGYLSLSTSEGFLIKKEGKVLPFIIKPYTLYLNFKSPYELEIGDKIKVHFKEKKGVPIAFKIEKLKKIHINPLFEIKESFFKENIKSYEIVDLREEEEFLKIHIPSSKREFIKNNKEIIFYCNDYYDEKCIEKFQNILIKEKANFLFFQGGIKEWNEKGNYFYTEPEILLKKEKIDFYLIDLRDEEERKKGVIPFSFYANLKEMDWRDFSSEEGMVPLLFIGKDERDERPIKAAEKVLKWRYEGKKNGYISILKGGIKGLEKIGFKLEIKEILPFKLSNLKKEGEIKLEELSKKDIFFVDLRAEGDADLKFAKNIKLSELDEKIEILPKDKEVILFCYEGKRAEIAFYILKKLGFNVKFINEPPFF